MSFAEWSKKKKNEQGQQSSSAPAGSSTLSFAEWSKNKAASSVDQNYINTFINDANDFLGSAERHYGLVEWGNASALYDAKSSAWNSLDVRSKAIRTWLEQNKSRLDEKTYGEFASMLDQFDKGALSVVSSFRKARDYYGQFATEDDYTRAKIGWLDTGAETTAEGAAARKSYYLGNKSRIKEIEESKPWIAGKNWIPNFMENWFLSDDEEAARDEYERLIAENNQYDREQGKIDKWFNPVTPEFTAISSNRGFSNASMEDIWGYDSQWNDISQTIYYGGTIDEQGNVYDASGKVKYAASDLTRAYLNGDRNSFLSKVIPDKLGMYKSASEEDLAEAYHRLSTNGGFDDTWATILTEGDKIHWDLLTPEEESNYYYILNTRGAAAAYEYLDDMTVILSKRATEARAEEIDDAGTLEQIALNIASIPMNIIGGAVGLLGDASNAIAGNEYNPYSNAHALSNDASAIRQKTAQDIDNAFGNFELPWIGYSFGDAYQALMSGADSMVGSVLGGTGYGILMGMGAASTEMKELYEKGVSTGQMIWGGILSGAAEMVFEKYSIDQLVKIKDAKTFRAVVVNVLKQGGVEASEEVFTEIANTISNYVIMGSQSDWEGFGQFVKKLVSSGLSGFISGGTSAGVISSVQNIGYNQSMKKHGMDILSEGGSDSLRDLAFEMAADENGLNADRIKKLAETTTDVATRKNARRVGKLSDLMGDTITEQNLSEIKSALAEKGFGKKDIARISAYIQRAQEGKTFAAKEADQAAIEDEVASDEKISGVLADLVWSEDSALNARTRKLLAARLGRYIGEGNVPAAAEQTEAKREFSASEDGKTILAETEEEVSIDEIVSVKKGSLKLKLTNGEVVDAKEVAFKSDEEALLYENVLHMGLNAATANAFIKGYSLSNGMSVSDYANGFGEAYMYGSHGMAMSEMTSEGFSALLSEDLRHRAYTLGQIDGKASVAAAQKAVTEIKEKAAASDKKASPKKGKVFLNGKEIKNGKKTGLEGIRDASVKGLITLADALGVDVHLYESYVTKTGKRVFRDADGKIKTAPHGFYDPKTGTIHIDLNAGKMGEGVILYTAAHELTHFIRGWSLAKFKVFADFLVENYAQKGKSVAELVQAQIQKAAKKGRQLSFDAAYEEVIADFCQAMLTDGNAIQKVAELKAKDKTLWEKIKDFISNIVAKIKEAYQGLDPYSAEGQFVKEHLDIFEQLQSMWVDALVDAGETYSEVRSALGADSIVKVNENGDVIPLSQRFNSENGDIRYSERNPDDEKMFNPEGKSLDEQLDSILHTAESFDGRYLYIGRFTSDFIDMVKQYVNISDLPIAMNYRDAYLSMESKENGKYSGDGINYHNLGKQGLKSAIESFGMPEQVLLSKKDGKIELILEVVDKKGNKLLSIVELNTFARNAKKYIEAHIVTSIYGRRNIDRYISKAKEEGRLIYSKKEEPSQGNSQVQYEGIINDSSSSNSISQSTDSVKRKFSDRDSEGHTLTAEQQEFFKDSKVRDSKGRLLPVYHGTYENFTVFDISKTADANAYGKGHYFTSKKSDAEHNYASIDGVDVGTKVDALALFFFEEMGYSEEDQYDNDNVGAWNAAYDKASEYYASGKVLQVYLNLTNPVFARGDALYDASGNIITLPMNEYEYEALKKLGFDGIIDSTVADRFGGFQDLDSDTVHYVVFDSNKIKLTSNKTPTSNPDIRYSERDFAEQVDKVFDGTFDRTNAVYVGATPKILQDVGLNGDLPMLTTARHLRNANKPKNAKKHYHGLTVEQLKALPEKIASPVMIMDSLDETSNCIVVVTDMLDPDGSPVVVIVKADGKGTHNSVEVDTNFVATYYGRDDFGGFIDLNVEADTFLFIDKEKSRKLSNPAKVQFFGKLEAYDFDTIIRQTRAVVNSFSENSDNGRKFSDRDYSYEALVSKPDMRLTVVGGNVPSNRADVVAEAKKNAAKVGKFNPKDGSVSVHVDDIGADVVISTGGLRHSLDRRFNVIAPVAVKAGEILQKSIRINEMIPENPNADSSYALIGAARNKKGELYIVRSVVNRFKSELVSMDVLYAINAKTEPNLGIKKGNQVGAYPQGTLSNDSFLTDSTISIAQLLEYVNRYFPDILPESVLRHFGHDARPDGKLGESVLYSDRDDSDISNRELLASALESTIDTSTQDGRNQLAKLKEYKAIVGQIEELEAERSRLVEEANELRFRKGRTPDETKRMKALDFEANQAANRIHTFDKKLLGLEAMSPVKKILQREKEIARKRAEKKGKEALAAYKERAAETQRKLLEKARESRQKGIEGRHKTEMRHKIKSITGELSDMLLKPTSKKHIKEELRKSVAEALSAINMDTVGADERVAHYNDMIARSNDPDVIAELTKSRDLIQLQGDNLQAKLTALRDAYEKIKNSEDIELNLAYQEVILNSIKAIQEKVGNTSIRNMTLEQLEMVYDLFSMIRKTIRNANKLFKQAKFETIMQTAEAVNDEVRKVGGEHYSRPQIFAAAQRIGWSMLKPYVAFRTIGSDTLTGLYKNLRAGEDTFFGDVSEAQAFIEEQYKKHGYKSWDMKKTKTFTAKSGKNFELTLEQMMSLYAYSRREQAHAHIIEGGIVFEDAVITKKKKFGVPVKYEVTTKDAFNLSEETLGEIISSLTAEQKAFVEEMQAYLSDVMGAKGNEVSMEFLGVKLFKEKFYLPIKSSQYYLNFSTEDAGEIKLKNPAFSRETVTHANNPIVLHSFTDLWAEHINNMSMYHSFVLALEDFTRVFNYKTKTDAKVETMDTKATIESAYAGATAYIRNFLKSLNGGVRMDTVGAAEKLTSLTKKGAVLGSASVAIQQPSAIMRAMAYINPVHFVVTTPKSLNLVKHGKDWAELKKYAPIAGIKEMGRFDVGMGKDTVDWIKSNKTVMNKVEDVLSVAPAFMDEVTWVAIWNAVKRETVHKHKNLKPNSEEFLKVAGERFTEVVSLSQVYDSVFSRSDLMRNKSWIAKALTAFMAEPTTTLNMLWDAWVQGKRSGSLKGFAKAATPTAGAVVSAIVLNAALKSIIMAMRDDDEDESYQEKYLEHFFGDLKDSLNPLTLIPIAKDVVSIFKGYDVERMDMALISDLKNAIDAFDSDAKTNYEKWSGLVGAISAFFGLPVKNVERDIRGLINTVFGDTESTTAAGIRNAIEEGWTGEGKSNGQQLYEAMLDGDQEQIERVKGRFKDQTAINSAIRKALRENDPRIKEAAQAVADEDYDKYTRIANEIIGEGHFSEADIVAAIKSEVNTMTEDEEKAETAKDKEVSLYEMDYFYSAAYGGNTSMAYAIREDIIQTAVANGKTLEDAEKNFNSSFQSRVRDKYEGGDLSDSEAIRLLVSYGGKTDEDASTKVQYWGFKKDNPDTYVSEYWIDAYNEDVASSGVSLELFIEYKNAVKDIDGDNAKARKMAVINSLPITNAQKTALYYAEGWAASKLYEAPWR